ncbi:DUF3347 domain-containing protein [Spirosoma sp.]|uniref:DUF3347 domain-containing protein n=1 Tax=Spirosoma sp. TaxID=1899569 RepID=UPI00262530D5|nr:DUF3347 domain-containing protein [Spirosoma sp.]MCX6218134.1 DUF3347 domain-containing protein [Spirosoma sp.]
MKTIRFTFAAVGLLLFSLAASAQTTAPALSAYYSVKDALVATDAPKAKSGATALVTALGKVDAARLSAIDKKNLATAKARAATISRTNNVDAQRTQFEALSTSMIALAKATKPAKTYVQYCPMAAEGKGAFWLSDKREVRNPYYGDKMLKCGSVKEEI